MAHHGSGASQVGRAWLAVCAALALHVADEALSGFLSVYNPTVMEIRARVPWLPLPVFDFSIWLAGLCVAIAVLTILSLFVFRGYGWTRPVAYGLAILMIANAVGHTVGTLAGRTFESVRFQGPLPGFYSSPLLFIASVWLLVSLRRSRQPGQL